MTEEHKDDHPAEEHHEETQAEEPVAVETFYDDSDDSSGSYFSFKGNPLGVVCSVASKAGDEVIRAVPGEVTEHLVNGHNEFLKAGIALVESGIRRAENIRQKSRDLHSADNKTAETH